MCFSKLSAETAKFAFAGEKLEGAVETEDDCFVCLGASWAIQLLSGTGLRIG